MKSKRCVWKITTTFSQPVPNCTVPLASTNKTGKSMWNVVTHWSNCQTSSDKCVHCHTWTKLSFRKTFSLFKITATEVFLNHLQIRTLDLLNGNQIPLRFEHNKTYLLYTKWLLYQFEKVTVSTYLSNFNKSNTSNKKFNCFFQTWITWVAIWSQLNTNTWS